MKLQKLSDVLEKVAQTATLWSPLLPPAAIVAMGAGLAANAASLFAQHDIAVVDESGNVLDLRAVEQAVAAEWDRVLQLLADGRAVAQREMDRTS